MKAEKTEYKFWGPKRPLILWTVVFWVMIVSVFLIGLSEDKPFAIISAIIGVIGWGVMFWFLGYISIFGPGKVILTKDSIFVPAFPKMELFELKYVDIEKSFFEDPTRIKLVHYDGRQITFKEDWFETPELYLEFRELVLSDLSSVF